jgi:hypothetical protein
MTIDLDRLLLEAGPLEPGRFMLTKCTFIEEGKNLNEGGRCYNLSYGSISPVMGTPYEKEAWEIGHKSGFDNYDLQVPSIAKWGNIISVVPHFFIDYVERKRAANDVSPASETSLTPMSMWMGRSIFQLFKTMREWSFMIEEPFNSDHPFAIYSKMAIDMLEIPQDILDEIDTMPDMHLAKFLKGQTDYKLIPAHPAMSQAFKQWIVDTTEKYPTLTFEQKLDAALNND